MGARRESPARTFHTVNSEQGLDRSAAEIAEAQASQSGGGGSTSPSQRRHQMRDALLAALVDSSDDAILTKSSDGVITTWNRSAERLFGYSAQEVIHTAVAVVVPCLSEERELLAAAMAGKSITGLETECCRRDGTTVVVSLTVSPVRDRTGRVIAVSVIARDVTARRNYLRRLRRVVEGYRAYTSGDLPTEGS